MNVSNWTMKLVASTILGLASVTNASAVTDTIFKYTTPKAAFYSISPMDMAPDSDSSAADYFVSWGGGLSKPSGSGCFNTGLHLPQGATITSVKVTYKSGIEGDLFVVLNSTILSTDETDDLVNNPISDDSSTRKTATFQVSGGDALVNNNRNVYGFGVCIYESNTIFYGALIGYTYTNAGD